MGLFLERILRLSFFISIILVIILGKFIISVIEDGIDFIYNSYANFKIRKLLVGNLETLIPVSIVGYLRRK